MPEGSKMTSQEASGQACRAVRQAKASVHEEMAEGYGETRLRRKKRGFGGGPFDHLWAELPDDVVRVEAGWGRFCR